MSDANGPQAVYVSAPEAVKHDHSYPQVHTAAATQQDQGWWGAQQQQQHPATPSTTYAATSPPPPPQPPAQTLRHDDDYHQQQQHEKPTAGSTRRRPNWLLAAAACLLGVIIGGAIVAGVLGSMLANRPSGGGTSGSATPATECKTADPARGTPAAGAANGTSSSSSAPATTGTPAPGAAPVMLTNYEAANWRNVSTLASPCPRVQGATVEAMDGTRYRVECGLDSNGRGKEAPFDMKDIQSVVAYSFEDCVRSCASFNKLSINVQGTSPSMVCRAVVWRRRMDEPQFFDTGGNCFLKNATRAADNKGITCDVCMTGTLL